jgi:hypothetical protein
MPTPTPDARSARARIAGLTLNARVGRTCADNVVSRTAGRPRGGTRLLARSLPHGGPRTKRRVVPGAAGTRAEGLPEHLTRRHMAGLRFHSSLGADGPLSGVGRPLASHWSNSTGDDAA